jgi:hypothetical protein
MTSAMAITTRWRMPPESWCGYSLARCAGAGMPTVSSILTGAVPRLAFGAGAVNPHHLGDLIANGEDGIQSRHRLLEDHRDASAAHGAHRLLVDRARFFPSKVISLPDSMRPGGRIRRKSESAVTDLPQPDSPTRPTVSPGAIAKLMPSTERATPDSV